MHAPEATHDDPDRRPVVEAGEDDNAAAHPPTGGSGALTNGRTDAPGPASRHLRAAGSTYSPDRPSATERSSMTSARASGPVVAARTGARQRGCLEHCVNVGLAAAVWALSGKDGQEIADLLLARERVGEGQVGLDCVVVAAAVTPP